MGRLLQTLLSPRAAPVLVVTVLVLVIYLVGNLSGVDLWKLHAAAAAVVALGAGLLVWQKARAQKAAGALEAALKAQGQSQAAGTRPDQRAGIEELKTTFDESLDLLRKSKMGRGALHSIPWYMLIGPPGSGKSTLLRQSGLSFPYMTKGRSAIRGLGGTKNCDWWFADRGILLHTAGRYTSETEDRDEWMAFLRLLKRGRGKRPVNGVVVAMGLAELVESTDAELNLHAENVRDRIDELTRELQTVFPIYVVFTKCDRLRGFVETFDTLNKEQRKQVWGFTFPFARPREFSVADQFGKEFDDLYRALVMRRVDLLASDHFKKRKAQVYAFPLQFLRLKERLQAFLGQLQQPNPYQEVSPVRGIYFTSGTQEGTTIDRILKVLRPADLELDVPEESRRCYFVDDLFNRVVFEDAPLAAPTVQAKKKDRLLRNGGLAVLGVLALVTIVWRWGTWSEFRSTCNQIAGFAGDPAKDAAAVREALDAQRRMLDSDNVQLDRGGVRESLAKHYDRTLVAYTKERLGTFALAEANAIKDTMPRAETASYEQVAAAEARLRLITTGVAVLRARPGDTRTADRDKALALWEKAVGSSDTGRKHFDHLFELGAEDMSIPAVEGAVSSARETLAGRLSDEQQRDLAAGKALSFDALFPASWKNLKEADSRFESSNAVAADARNWSSRAMTTGAKGPLFAKVSAKPGALTIEQFFEGLQGDVDRAIALSGRTSQRPLRDLAGGGWTDHVEQQRRAFLALVESDFDRNWTSFLGSLQALAKAGGEAKDEDDCGCRRLGVVPELLAAYRIGRDVLGKQGVVSGEHAAAFARVVEDETKRHQHKETDWAKAPGAVQPGQQPQQVIERSKRAAKYLAGERQRVVDYDWRLPAMRESFQELEIALVEAICNREYAACRAELEAFAKGKPFTAWRAMLDRFPFAAGSGEDANAQQLVEAVREMTALDDAIGQLEPASAFAPDPAFAKSLEGARQLRQILYGGSAVKDVPAIETTLAIETQGGIAEVRIEGEARSVAIPPAKEEKWDLGPPESLAFTVKMSTGETWSFAELLDPRVSAGGNWLFNKRLVTGPWGLKRMFSLGKTEVLPGGERMSTLRFRGRTDDMVLLIVKTLRKEAIVVFDADWPGERYALANTMWKRP